MSLLQLVLILHCCVAYHHTWLQANAEKTARRGQCLEDLLQDLHKNAFKASSVWQEKESEQHQAYQARLTGILNNDAKVLAQAWCPAERVDQSPLEWLEINLPSLHLISTILTRGRRQGNVEQVTPAYVLRYQREDNGVWYNYSMANGTQVLTANTDSYHHVRKSLERPIVAKRVRIYPVNTKPEPRDVCLKLKLFGCPFEDGVVEYRSPAGFVSSMTDASRPHYRLVDRSYDGLVPACQDDPEQEDNGPRPPCWLQGGIGLLMDNVVHDTSAMLAFTHPDSEAMRHFVGWNLPVVRLVIRFQDVYRINSLNISMVNHPDLEMAPFRRLALRATLQDICPTDLPRHPQLPPEKVSQFILEPFDEDNRVAAVKSIFINTVNRSSSSSLNERSHGEPLIGRYLCLEFVPLKKFLLVGEIVVSGNRLHLSAGETLRRMRLEDGDLLTSTIQTPISSPFPSSEQNSQPSDSTKSANISTKSSVMNASESPYTIVLIVFVLFAILSFIMLIVVLLRGRHYIASSCCGKHKSCCCAQFHVRRRCTSYPVARDDTLDQHPGTYALANGYLGAGSKQWIDYIPSPAHGANSATRPLVRSNTGSPVNPSPGYYYPTMAGYHALCPTGPGPGFYPAGSPANLMHFGHGTVYPASPGGLHFMNTSTYLPATTSHRQAACPGDENKDLPPIYLPGGSILTDDSNTSHIYELANHAACGTISRPATNRTSTVQGRGVTQQGEEAASLLHQQTGRVEQEEEKPLGCWTSAPSSSGNSSSGRGSSDTCGGPTGGPQHSTSSPSQQPSDYANQSLMRSERPPLPPNHPSTLGQPLPSLSSSQMMAPYPVQGLMLPDSRGNPLVAPVFSPFLPHPQQPGSSGPVRPPFQH